MGFLFFFGLLFVFRPHPALGITPGSVLRNPSWRRKKKEKGRRQEERKGRKEEEEKEKEVEEEKEEEVEELCAKKKN